MATTTCATVVPTGAPDLNTVHPDTIRRVKAELKRISRDGGAEGLQVKLHDHHLLEWRVKMAGFSEDSTDENEVTLARDMNRAGVRFIELRVLFPPTYPHAPPFVRVIAPIFRWRTGHVTLGGAVCMEILTNQGWSSEMTVLGVLQLVRVNLLEGGARLARERRGQYDADEARTAFYRMLRTHGWK